MLQSVSSKEILEFRTYILDDHKTAIQLNKHANFQRNKTNIIYSINSQRLQGSYFLRFLQDELEKKVSFSF